MAVLRLATLVIVLSLAHDVKGATDVAVDASCTYGTDTCVSGALCDPTLNKCEYKSGVICASAAGKCVTGATCATTSDACVCTTASGFVARTDGYCGLISGKACTTKTPCVDNAECAASGNCACKTGYYAKTDGTCAANITIDASCTYGTDTCVTGALCDQTLNKCEYKSGVTCASAAGKCVTGATCATTSDACVCTTASGFVARTDGYCGLISGKSCTSKTPCVDNAECSTSGKCECKSGYTAKTDGTCSGAVGLVGSFVLLMAAIFTATRLI